LGVETGKVPAIGFISNNAGALVGSFRPGLRDHGYVEGKNILVEYRYIEGNRERNPSLVAELVELNVDILVATSPPPLRMLLAKSIIGSRESEGAGLKTGY
jgi:hypothetical protein